MVVATGNGGTNLSGGTASAVQEKINEYAILAAPVERALRDLQLTRGMLRARAEDEINALSPALAVLSETLGVSTLDLLTANDRAAFLQEAVRNSRVPIDEVRSRLIDAQSEAGEPLQTLALPADPA